MNLFKLFIKIGAKDEASDKIANISQKLGNGLKTAAKVGTVAVTTAMTGIVALTTAATKNYAEYEQLIGGTELMFGKAFDYVKKQSQNAYKTVQMSQNEYLQQVNGFATGLKTALGDNEKAAAELAHKIVQAEADVVAATGETQENIQNAFNGIMKNNFQMLDNLKLGINPTKEGFQEVIDKVNEWNATNNEATNYQMGNLADMQSALVDYIDMVGMSGYAQREASETIQGSLASTKSAWDNLLTGIADKDADLSQLTTNLVESIVGYVDESGEEVKGLADNLLPVVETALDGAVDLIEGLFPKIIELLPKWVGETLPALADSAVLIVETLVNSLSDNSDMLAENAIDVVFTLANGILNLLPKIIKLGLDLIVSLATGITTAIQENDFINTIIDVVKQIVEILTNPDSLAIIINSALDLILALVEGLLNDESITALIDAVFLLIDNIILFLLDEENITKIIDTGVKFALTFWGGIWKARWRLLQGIVELALTLMGKIENMDWKEIGKNIINTLWNGISEVWNNLVYWFENELSWFSDVGDTISSIFGGGSSFGGGANARINGSHAGGLISVPFDGYVAQLHKEERVLTAQEARNYNDMQMGKDVNVNISFDDESLSINKLARVLYPALKVVEKEVYA